MNANRPTDSADPALTPREAEFLTLLFQVCPEQRLEVLREMLAIDQAHQSGTVIH